MEPAVNQNIAPPFKPDDIVVAIDHPFLGSMTVSVVEPHPKGGWRIGYRREGGVTGIAYDEEIMRVPQGWVEPPARPVSARERLLLAHSAGIPVTAWAAAVEADNGNRDQFLRYTREVIAWWLNCGARVNLALASQQIAAAGTALADLEREMGIV